MTGQNFGRLLFPAFLLAWLACSCGGDDGTSPGPEPEPPLATGTIDGSGGELVHPDVVLTIPPGALAATSDLAIYAEDKGHPFGEDSIPVYRITGLPSALDSPLTLRIQHHLNLAHDDSLAFFLGEQREAFSGGNGLSWESVACRDSSGWCIARLERGPLTLGNKQKGDLKAAVSGQTDAIILEDGHFTMVFNKSQVKREDASAALGTFESVYEMLFTWGFRFGDDPSIWPVDVYLDNFDGLIARYVVGPRGKGHFDLEFDLVLPAYDLTPIAAHEIFHMAQSFYDPRDPDQWGTLNQERLWLDEASSAWLESISYTGEDHFPLGMNDDNYAALLKGIAGHPDLDNAEYGYGMASFIRCLIEDPDSGQGEDRLLELFQSFAVGGDVTDAIDEVVDPPLSTWCLGMQQKLVEGRIYPTYPNVPFWYMWPQGGSLDDADDAQETRAMTVPDLGANILKLFLEGDTPPDLTALMVRADQANSGQSRERLPITVYGRAPDSPPVRIAAGVDSLVIPDWPAVHQAYKDLLVMVSRPFSTGTHHEGSREIEVTAKVQVDLSGIDITRFDNVVIEVWTDNTFNNSGPIFNDIISVQAEVTWGGNGFFLTTPTRTISIPLDPATLTLGTWYGSDEGTTIGGNYFRRRLGGRGVPLSQWSNDELIYYLGGLETCDYLTEVFESQARDVNADPFSYLVSYSCHDNVVIYDRSGIYLHFFWVK